MCPSLTALLLQASCAGSQLSSVRGRCDACHGPWVPTPSLPAVVALSQQVFAAAAGEHMASAVCAFLRRQRLTSLRCGDAALASF